LVAYLLLCFCWKFSCIGYFHAAIVTYLRNIFSYLIAGLILGNISWLLTILARAGKYSSVGSLAIVLAQHSVKFVAGLDGFKPMMPGNPELKKVLKAIPKPRKKTLFLPVVGDWDDSLVRDSRWYKRWSAKGIDKLLSTILDDKEHDWVVSSTNQAIVPSGSAVKGFSKKPFVESLHTRYFQKEKVPERIKEFMLHGKIN